MSNELYFYVLSKFMDLFLSPNVITEGKLQTFISKFLCLHLYLLKIYRIVDAICALINNYY